MEKGNSRLKNEELTEILISQICRQLSRRNWSLKMLADKADLPYETVKKLISRKIGKPSFFSIWRIAEALDCSVDQLTGKKDPSAAAWRQVSDKVSEISRILPDMEKRY